MTKIRAKAIFKIEENKVDLFKQIATECIAVVKEKDQSTHKYDWFFSDNLCVVEEAFENSNGMLTHLKNLGSLPSKLIEIASFDLEIYGDPSEALLEATSGLNPKIYKFYKGL